MSWTHSICSSCYKEHEGDRVPTAVKDTRTEVCCFCGEMTAEGIYYRYDPSQILCKGQHDE